MLDKNTFDIQSKLDARVIKKGLYSPLYIELHNKILTATKRREYEDIFISLLEEELQQIRNAMGKVYQGTYHGKTNDRRKNIENYLPKKFNHCKTDSKKWIRTYKAMKEKLAKELARKYQAFVEKVLETMLDEIVETVVVFMFLKIPFYDRFKLKDIIKHYTRIRDQGLTIPTGALKSFLDVPWSAESSFMDGHCQNAHPKAL
ncbi:hypothetical protein DAPPUDRAFT_324803 [Daphnia pulex]|uniref:Uncharacterized protein n=1 Tax=Daphnia pulex TaxID=6669 RepID=E9H2R8_DAPPU|nr:hypothetical protein DAPPUDRAFT_324803 [Daphnia pulex]|eukprot:EFX73964.1 hypothetical protein DAPPUDRAFT_324803 [Daphnia pulex]